MNLITFAPQSRKYTMFFKSLKKKVHYFFVKKNLHKLFFPVNDTHLTNRVLVVVDDILKKNEIKKELTAVFNSKKHSIDFLIFQNKKDKKKECIECIYPSDFGWFGSVSSQKTNPILTKNYNLLINYCKVDYVYINTLLLHCKIDFRVGFSQLNSQYYDLQINCNTNNTTLFTKELNKYLVLLNKL